MGGRSVAAVQLLAQQPEVFDPTVRAIIQKGHDFHAMMPITPEYLKRETSKRS